MKIYYVLPMQYALTFYSLSEEYFIFTYVYRIKFIILYSPSKCTELYYCILHNTTQLYCIPITF